MNAKMAELVKAFEAAGFTDVVTRLSSGNVIFSAPAASDSTLARKAEAGMMQRLGRSFLTIVRSIDELREILAKDPYKKFKLAPQEKRIVTFLLEKPSKVKLPIESNGTRILFTDGRAVFSTYVPAVSGPDFMTLLEKSFGKEVTTRTWETVAKVAR